jgi:ubiquinone/menaquinone biosynthesis C-methylase UbiE
MEMGNVTSAYWRDPADDAFALASRWKSQGRTRLLDLGCGPGRHAILFAQNGFQVTGFDLSDEGLKELADRAAELGLEVETVKGDVVSLPFGDGVFDCAIAYQSIYHVDSGGMAAALGEARRVLAPGGEFFITLIAKEGSPTDGFIDANVKMKREEDGSILPHYYVGEDELGPTLSGFEILSARYVRDLRKDGKASPHYHIRARKI